MPEPTIDDMLIWVSGLEHWNPDTLNDNKIMLRAIRAILEHQRLVESPVEKIQLAAVRAFVERVEKRLPDYDTGRGADSWLRGYRSAVEDELAAMEREAE